MIEHKCRICAYNTYKICDYNKHLTTKKHKKNLLKIRYFLINNNIINSA